MDIVHVDCPPTVIVVPTFDFILYFVVNCLFYWYLTRSFSFLGWRCWLAVLLFFWSGFAIKFQLLIVGLLAK